LLERDHVALALLELKEVEPACRVEAEPNGYRLMECGLAARVIDRCDLEAAADLAEQEGVKATYVQPYPGSSAPLGSATVPPILPKPCANIEIGAINDTTKIIRRLMISSRHVSHGDILLRHTRFCEILGTTLMAPGKDVKGRKK